VGDAADDLVTVHPHRGEIAVANACDFEHTLRMRMILNISVRMILTSCGPPHTVADRPGADADDVDRLLQERVERDDLVHLAAADVHVVGQRVRELGRQRADLAADPPEVVEQSRPVGRKLREERGQGEDVRAPIIAATRQAA
jgi:hypothetical protein